MRRDAALADPAGSEDASRTCRPAGPRTMVHASCVRLGGRGVVLLGASGSGKSDLALRLIDAGAVLVADDQLLVERRGSRLVGGAPDNLAGLLEVRGIGIFRLPRCDATTLDLAVGLAPADEIQRLPDAAAYPLLGVELPCLHIDPRRPSAAAAVRLAISSERFA